jgi:hypothetical protein
MKKIATIFALLISTHSFGYWVVLPKVGSLEVTCRYTEIEPEVLMNFYNTYLAKRGYEVHNMLPYDYYDRGPEGRYSITTYRKVGVRKLFVAVFEDEMPCRQVVNKTF